jgi:proteasome lid subunit RPN8/RPN11
MNRSGEFGYEYLLDEATRLLWEKGYMDDVTVERNLPSFASKLEEIILSEAAVELKGDTYQEFSGLRTYWKGRLKCIGFAPAKDSVVSVDEFGSRFARSEIIYTLPKQFSALIHYHSHPLQSIAVPSDVDVDSWKEMAFDISPKPFYAIIYAQESKRCFWYSVAE